MHGIGGFPEIHLESHHFCIKRTESSRKPEYEPVQAPCATYLCFWHRNIKISNRWQGKGTLLPSSKNTCLFNSPCAFTASRRPSSSSETFRIIIRTKMGQIGIYHCIDIKRKTGASLYRKPGIFWPTLPVFDRFYQAFRVTHPYHWQQNIQQLSILGTIKPD